MAAPVADGYSAQKCGRKNHLSGGPGIAMNEERRIQSDGSAVFLGVGAILVLRRISADSA